MATDGKATWWDASSGAPAYVAQELRQIDALEVMPGPVSEPFSGRPGRRVNGKGLEVTVSSTGNGSVTVAAGVCLLYSSAQASQGVWRAQFPQIGPIALGARPTSGQSRIDLVVARLYDSGSGVGSVKEAKIEVIAGSPNATPSAPSLPAGAIYLELDRLTVPSSGTITHVQTTQRTVAAGGILPIDTTAERDALVAAGIAYRGLVVDNAQTGGLERYTGSGWVSITDNTRVRKDKFLQSAASGTNSYAVSFSPAFPSGQVPIVLLTLRDTNMDWITIGTADVTNTGFNIRVRNGFDSPLSTAADWRAELL